MESRKTVCLDFDGVLAYYTKWKGMEHIGEPNSEGVKLARMLYDAGIQIVIQTCRLNGQWPEQDYDKQRHMLVKWLEENNVPFHMLATQKSGKPFANCYVDDLGVHFPPNCNDCADAIYSQVLEMLYR